MHISYFNIGMQVVNLLVLVALLRRFLYRPMLAIIEKRQEAVRKAQDEAAQAERQAATRAADYEAKLAALAEERVRALAQAEAEGAQAAAALTQAAGKYAEELQARGREALQKERAAALGDLKEQAVRLGGEIAERLLLDLAGPALDQLLAMQAARRLCALQPTERAQLARQLASGPVEVAAAHPLEPAAVTALRQALQALLESGAAPSATLDLRLTAEPSLGAGIELRLVHGTWPFHLRSTLDRLQRELLR